ncbi:hypothetical protein [Halarcobacter sp.]|uniref:hypothetical protein n=1 Tax=Halarcobacter sp. TaxID=2321133 RepID=UPI0029F47183|nr:hypothetical protein [Halarcobacter sp.]
MKNKKFLSYEAKIILAIILVISFVLLPFSISDYLFSYEDNLKNLYYKYLDKYPLWIDMLVLISPVIIYILISQIRKNRSDYKEDIIYNVKWKWEWSRNDIVNLQCFCPTCGEELYYESLYNDNNLKLQKLDFICDKCNKVVTSIPYSNNVSRSSLNIKKEIERVIRKKMMKK